MRRATARSDPAAGPSSLPGAAVSQPCGARSCGSARDLPVRESARLGPAVELVPGRARILERGASSVAAQAGGANPGDAGAGDRWRARPSAARLRRELGVRPRHDAGTGLDAPATRAAARLQRAHAVERPRTVASSAPRASDAGAADGRVHRGELAGGGAAAGAWGLAVACAGGASERGPGRPRRSGGRTACPRARRAGPRAGRRAARGGQEPRRPDRSVRGRGLRRGGGRARDPRSGAARTGAALARVAAGSPAGASGPGRVADSSATCMRMPTCWRS